MSQKIVIFPDAHWPFVSKRAWNLACEAAAWFKPDIFVNLGDCYDFNVVKSHPRTSSEKERFFLHEELHKARKARPDMEALGASKNFFLLGNHEDRLDRYVADRCPELTGKVSALNALRDDLGYGNGNWRIVPYRQHIRIGKVYFTHDVGHAGVGAVRQSQAAFESSVVIGHTHRIEYIIRGNVVGKPHLGASFGWLGDPRQAEYMYQVKVNREWAHGFGYGYIESGGTTFLIPSPIIDNKCRVEGKLFHG